MFAVASREAKESDSSTTVELAYRSFHNDIEQSRELSESYFS